MNFISQPNGTVCFGLGIDELQSCLGYGLTVCIIKDGDGNLLAVETWVDDKAQILFLLILQTKVLKRKFRLLR